MKLSSPGNGGFFISLFIALLLWSETDCMVETGSSDAYNSNSILKRGPSPQEEDMNFSEIKTLIAGSYFVVADAANPVISRYYTREGLSPALDTCTIAGIEPIGCLKKSLFEDAAPDEYVAAVKLVMNLSGDAGDYEPNRGHESKTTSAQSGPTPSSGIQVDEATKKAIREAMDQLPNMMPSMEEMMQASAEMMKNPEIMNNVMKNFNMEDASKMLSQMFGGQTAADDEESGEDSEDEFELIDDDDE